jgi:TonB family protein
MPLHFYECMRDFAFAEATPELVPAHKRSTLPIAVAIHALVALVLIQVTLRPVRVTSAGEPQTGIAAFVTGPPVEAGPAAPPKPKEAKTALKTEPKQAEESQSTAGSAGVAGAEMPSGPVRIGSGGTITLLKKVQPIYPEMMRSARMLGNVVLDAIIHADGTIGDVTVLSSTNQAFAQSAINAVKQWKYETIGFEAIVTVTVNFTLTD